MSGNGGAETLDMETSREYLTSKQKWIRFFKMNALTFFTVFGVLMGVVVGMILRHTRDTKWPAREIMYVSFVGEIFLQVFQPYLRFNSLNSNKIFLFILVVYFYFLLHRISL